jgi:hypothetical protein
MKNKLILIIAAGIIAGCNSGDKKANAPEEETSDTVTTINPSPDSLQTIINPSIIWSVDEENPGKEKLKKPEAVILDTLSSAQLVEMINENYPDIHLDLVKVSHDTLYVKIPDSQRLTSQIGDSGAENYLASATFTLTETKNIKYINFSFKRGDHADPGVYSRNDFKSLR